MDTGFILGVVLFIAAAGLISLLFFILISLLLSASSRPKTERSSSIPKEPWKRVLDVELEQRAQAELLKEKQAHEEAEAKLRQRLEEERLSFSCAACRCVPQSVVFKHENIVDGDSYYTNHWYEPANFLRCHKCGLWFCDKHRYQGKCKDCWEKELGKPLG